jgi:hypothetical protein
MSVTGDGRDLSPVAATVIGQLPLISDIIASG